MSELDADQDVRGVLA